MNELVKHIKEYFNTFNHKDYTIHVDGTPTEKCELNDYTNYVVWRPLDNNELDWRPLDNNELDWYFINVCQIEAIRLTPTTMEIIKTDSKTYKFVAKLKTKEEKAKDIIFKAKMALHDHYYVGALKYLDELRALMDES